MIAYPHMRRIGARGSHRRSALAAASLLALFSLAACGGGQDSSRGSDRPSVADIEGQIAKSSGDQVTEDQSACLAKTYYESDLSDEAVRLLVEAEDVSKISPDDLSEADQKASKELYEPLVKCLTPERSRE
ncbi:hypothetical protein ACFVJS_22000 [Nocardioides sp. NPDC057772]|uniref:hypothetical protein n=1 Tax=Nocardioides sp. NPDC057772 TaxID=3346245 RepID=UPI0036711549